MRIDEFVSTQEVLRKLQAKSHEAQDHIALCHRGIELARNTRDLKSMVTACFSNEHLICALIDRANVMGHDDGVNDH